MSAALHVAAAAVLDDAGRVLIARRAVHRHQGGLWEFPGGKLEPGESVQQALARELWEELHIRPLRSRPLIRVPHRYPDREVVLDVWRVEAYAGTAEGREGQPLRWVAPAELDAYPFPAANLPIVRAVQLPERYLVTPEPEAPEVFLAALQGALEEGLRLVQLRAKGLGAQDYRALARRCLPLTRRYGAKLLLNAAPELVAQVGADGVHLASAQLHALQERPLPRGQLVAASCHDAAELQHAAALGADFAVLAPVAATASHPQARPLGWEAFEHLVRDVPLPVYALGGMRDADLERAWAAGGQGIAAIRSLWAGP